MINYPFYAQYPPAAWYWSSLIEKGIVTKNNYYLQEYFTMLKYG
jgi:hypothetical protein